MTKRVYSLGLAILAVSLFPALAVGAADTLTLPAGSNLNVRLTTTLSTRTNQSGDPWMAQVVEPIISGGEEVVPTGSTVEGRVTYVKPPGRVKGVGEMRLIAESITTVEGTRYLISASLEDAQGAEGAKVKGEEGTIKGPSVVRQTDTILFRVAWPLFTFSKISEALAVQIKGFGFWLCCAI